MTLCPLLLLRIQLIGLEVHELLTSTFDVCNRNHNSVPQESQSEGNGGEWRSVRSDDIIGYFIQADYRFNITHLSVLLICIQYLLFMIIDDYHFH